MYKTCFCFVSVAVGGFFKKTRILDLRVGLFSNKTRFRVVSVVKKASFQFNHAICWHD
jgi:hypothetical protein